MKTANLAQARSVLVVKPSSLGDIVHTLPAVQALKAAFPHLLIDWLVNPEWQPLLAGNPDLREMVPFPRRTFKGQGGLARYRTWMEDFKWRPPPDVALDFQGLLRSAWLCRKSGAGRIVGLSDSREGARFLHHARVPVERTDHAVDRYLRLVHACGVPPGPVQFPLPAGSIPEGLHKATLPKDFVILHPFSRGDGKSLTATQVNLFCDAMAPVGVFVVGVTDASRPPLTLPGNAFNLLNHTTLPELIWLMRRAKYIVSVDSGPMHIAAAITAQVLSLHTWSDPRLVGPYPLAAHVWKDGQILPRAQVDARLAARARQIVDADIEPMAVFVLGMLGA